MPPDLWEDKNGVRCLSGKPIGSRKFAEGCTCDWCWPKQFLHARNNPRPVLFEDLELTARSHDTRGFNRDQLVKCVKTLNDMGYKWDPKLKKPIAPVK